MISRSLLDAAARFGAGLTAGGVLGHDRGGRGLARVAIAVLLECVAGSWIGVADWPVSLLGFFVGLGAVPSPGVENRLALVAGSWLGAAAGLGLFAGAWRHAVYAGLFGLVSGAIAYPAERVSGHATRWRVHIALKGAGAIAPLLIRLREPGTEITDLGWDREPSTGGTIISMNVKSTDPLSTSRFVDTLTHHASVRGVEMERAK